MLTDYSCEADKPQLLKKSFFEVKNLVLGYFEKKTKGFLMSQVSIHVAGAHQISKQQTLKSQTQMVGPYARFV